MGDRLAGKTILITGASSGIGRSTAKEFVRTASGNIRLVLAARRIEALRSLADEIKGIGQGTKVHLLQLDVSNSDEIASLVLNLPEQFCEIDILVNNA
jgi:3-hydroxy acid dehydrogenase/malonic semialdehyde reductase